MTGLLVGPQRATQNQRGREEERDGKQVREKGKEGIFLSLTLSLSLSITPHPLQLLVKTREKDP